MAFEKNDIYKTGATIIGALSLMVFNSATTKIEEMSQTMARMNKNISDLNVQMAKVIVQDHTQTVNDKRLEKRIEKLEDRLEQR